MFKNRVTILILFLIPAACASPARNAEGKNWVAFSAENAQADEMLGWLFSGNAEYWSPAKGDVNTLEDGLPAYLQENQSAFYMTEAPVWEQLGDYNRQYIGIIVDGKRIIYANYFCKTGGSTEWKTQFVLVADGGACYFQVKFDNSTGGFFDLQVNGEA